MYKLCFAIALLSGLFLSNAYAKDIYNYKFKRTFPNAAGAVNFDHEAHAMGRVKDCEFCHSALKTFGGKVNELFAHNICKVCHASKNGPTECAGCHNRAKVSAK